MRRFHSRINTLGMSPHEVPFKRHPWGATREHTGIRLSGAFEGTVALVHLERGLVISFAVQAASLKRFRTKSISPWTPGWSFSMCPFLIVRIVLIAIIVAFAELRERKGWRVPSSRFRAA